MVRIDLQFAPDTVFAHTFFYCVPQASGKKRFSHDTAVIANIQVCISILLENRSWMHKNRTIILNLSGCLVVPHLAACIRDQSNRRQKSFPRRIGPHTPSHELKDHGPRWVQRYAHFRAHSSFEVFAYLFYVGPRLKFRRFYLQI